MLHRSTALLLALLLAISGCQLQQANASNQTTISLYQSGDIEGAIRSARSTLKDIEDEFGAQHSNTATAIENLAVLLRARDQHQEALQLLLRASDIRAKISDQPDDAFALTLIDIANLEHDMGRPDQALDSVNRALKLLNKSGADSNRVLALNTRTNIYISAGQTEKAHDDINTALALLKDHSSRDSQNIALLTILYNQKANLALTEGRLDMARNNFNLALSAQLKSDTTNHLALAVVYNNLAELENSAGNYQQARNYYFDALHQLKSQEVPDSARIAIVFSNLSGLEQRLGNFQEAIDLIKQAISLQQQHLGHNHPELSPSLTRLAGIYYAAAQYGLARDYTRQALEIYQQHKSTSPSSLIQTLANQGEVERKLNNHGEAMTLYQRALESSQASYGDNSLLTAKILSNRAALFQELGQTDKAISDYRQSIDIISTTLGNNNPLLIDISYGLALALKNKNAPLQALNAFRKASHIIEERFSSNDQSDSGNFEVRQYRKIIEDHIDHLASLEATAEYINESFRLAQLAHASSTATATQQMAARFASGDTELSRLVRKRELQLLTISGLEKDFVQTAGNHQHGSNDSSILKLKKQIKKARKVLSDIDDSLRQQYPRYFDLAGHQSMNINDLQALLSAKEAMLTYLVTDNTTYAWVITSASATLARLNGGSKEMATIVEKLRRELDPRYLKNLEHFNGQPAYEAYTRLIKPIQQHLVSTNNLIIVPDKSLYSLPFESLLSTSQAFTAAAELSNGNWLIKRYAFSYLPSSASLRAIRQHAGKSRARQSFLGIGNPVFDKQYPNTNPASLRGSENAVKIAKSLSASVPLPETEQELNIMADIYGKNNSRLVLREKASESEIKKRIRLDDYQVIAFATHGLVVGELDEIDEPGLVLSLPDNPKGENDGFLKASEISQLNLDADWVILSACNTASTDGSPEADGLSGLVRAFFHAGSRSLLVSHWAVVSDATVQLTTNTITNLKKSPQTGRAGAHQQSILNMIASSRFSHPSIWAPFVVVGDGS
jgi:CHAT domain-containing protein